MITVHQLVQGIALTWADTPSLLAIPRSETNSTKPMPNLGLIIVPSERVLNAQGPDSSENASFTIFRLASDLSIVGDMYAKEADVVHDLTQFGVGEGKKRRSVSSNLISDFEENDEDWVSGQSNRKIDFTEVANIVVPAIPPTAVTPQTALQQLKRNILDYIESRRNSPFDTMYPHTSDVCNNKATYQVSGYAFDAIRCIDVYYRASSS